MTTRQGKMDAVRSHRSIHQTGPVRAIEINGAPGVELLILRYNVVDDYGSVWLPGCVAAGLNQRLPQLAWGHDRTQIIGRAVREGIYENEEGQIVPFRFANFAKVPKAEEIHSLVVDEIIDECSVGFRWEYEYRTPTDEDKQRWPNAREIITEAFVSETSLVMEGAVPGARVLSFSRSRLLGLRSPEMIDKEEAARIITQFAADVERGEGDLFTALQAVKNFATTSVEGNEDKVPETEIGDKKEEEQEQELEAPDDTKEASDETDVEDEQEKPLEEISVSELDAELASELDAVDAVLAGRSAI